MKLVRCLVVPVHFKVANAKSKRVALQLYTISQTSFLQRQRVSEAIGSIDVSTEVEKRQEYANTNAEPRSLSFRFPSQIEESSCHCGLRLSLTTAPTSLILINATFGCFRKGESGTSLKGGWRGNSTRGW
jgi:hypothetical protein